MKETMKFFKEVISAFAGVAQWTERSLILGQGTWVARQVPSGVLARGNHTVMFFSLFLPSPL